MASHTGDGWENSARHLPMETGRVVAPRVRLLSLRDRGLFRSTTTTSPIGRLVVRVTTTASRAHTSRNSSRAAPSASRGSAPRFVVGRQPVTVVAQSRNHAITQPHNGHNHRPRHHHTITTITTVTQSRNHTTDRDRGLNHTTTNHTTTQPHKDATRDRPRGARRAARGSSGRSPCAPARPRRQTTPARRQAPSFDRGARSAERACSGRARAHDASHRPLHRTTGVRVTPEANAPPATRSRTWALC